MERIEELIEESRNIIKNSRRQKLLDVSKLIEKYMLQLEIPIKESYEEQNYYIIVGYPYLEFLNHSRNISLLKLELSTKFNIPEENFRHQYTIYNYITELYLDQFLLLQLINPFYPKENKKFTLDTYKAGSRFDSEPEKPKQFNKTIFNIDFAINEKIIDYKPGNIIYIHPKYYLETLHHNLYQPEQADNRNEIMSSIYLGWKRWSKIDDELSSTIESRPDVKSKNIGYAMAHKIDKYIILADYDESAVICIAAEKDKEEILDTIKPSFKVTDIVENSSKSIYDSRLKNVVIKVGGNIVMKIWTLLDYDLIPYTPAKIRVAHPYVNMRLALSEYLTYDILDIKQLAKMKLKKYKQILNYTKKLESEKLLPNLDQCKYAGIYYPNDQYLKDLRIRDIVYRIKQSKKN